MKKAALIGLCLTLFLVFLTACSSEAVNNPSPTSEVLSTDNLETSKLTEAITTKENTTAASLPDSNQLAFGKDDVTNVSTEPENKEVKPTETQESKKTTESVSEQPENKSDDTPISVEPAITEPPKETQPPTEAPKQEQETPPPVVEEGKPKSIYDYEFDISAIKAELISLGQSMGLTHITSDDGIECTPATCSWAMPVTASQNFQGTQLENSLKDYVRSMPSLVTAYGGAEIDYFTIYVESLGSGSYTIYFLY